MFSNLVFKSSQVLVVIFFFLSGCKDNGNPVSPCGGIEPGIVPEPPYDSPIWHPGGQFIGFNHTPLKRITYPRGEQCWGVQEFDRDSAGFWLINPDGTNMRRIFPYKLNTPAWSADGEWIAFGAGAQIFKMRFTGTTFDTTTLLQLTTVGRNFFPAWSPDGQWIAYDRSLPDTSGPAGIWRMKFDGTLKQALFGGAFPTWHPNGIILLGATGATKFVRYDVAQQTVIDTLSTLTGNYNPRYSPTATKISFWSSGNLWMMDSSGATVQQLTTEGVDGDFGLPSSWSPDGASIVYTAYRSSVWTYTNGVLWIINPYTGVKRQLTFNRIPLN